MEAKIVFTDGTEINAEKNGSCLITNTEPVLPADLSGMYIESEEGIQEFEYPVFVECASADGRYWFSFIEESKTDRTIRELREENAMLEDAIIELAEIIGGE